MTSFGVERRCTGRARRKGGAMDAAAMNLGGSRALPEKRGAASSCHMRALLEGMRDGVPIALGYLAVSFSLGISAAASGLDPVQAFVASLLCNASAGEFAAFSAIARQAPVLELICVTAIANARYILMGASLAQRFDARTPAWIRALVASDSTDELFSIALARPGKIDPAYCFGSYIPALPGWAAGGLLGAVLGNVLPGCILEALSVALFGMFLAVIVPAARKERAVAWVVLATFSLSIAAGAAPLISGLSEGICTVILTFLVAGGAAWLFPITDGKPHWRFEHAGRKLPVREGEPA